MFLIRPCHGALLHLLQQMLGNCAIKAGLIAILSCQHYRLQIILFDNITDIKNDTCDTKNNLFHLRKQLLSKKGQLKRN